MAATARKPRGLMITASDGRAGKTLIGCALAFAARSRGIRVGVMKPIGTGSARDAIHADVRGLAYAAGSDLPLESMTPAGDLAEIVQAYREIAAMNDFVIVEGAGAIADPIVEDKTSADLALALGIPAVMVVANRAGCVDVASRSMTYAASRGITLVGWILNDTDASADGAIETALGPMSAVPFLGRVRFKEPVRREIIDPLLSPAE